MSFEVDNSRMFKGVYVHNLDRNKNWYAYNKSFLGYQENRNPEASKTFRCFPSEVKRVKLEELRDDERGQVSWRHFYVGRTYIGAVMLQCTIFSICKHAMRIFTRIIVFILL